MGIMERIRLLLETRKHKKYDAAKEFDRHGFRLVRCLSRGRFGSIHLAESKVNNSGTPDQQGRRIRHQQVAIKTNEEGDCMVGEKLLWQRLRHQHCVRLYERFSVRGYAHFVCEYVSHGDVMTWLEKSGQPLGPHLEPFAGQMARHILLALDYCHGLGLAHLDIRWANVLLDDAMNAKLTGFAYMCSKTDAEGICLGDPLYQPPEALTTGVSREDMDKVDVWQLGTALVHLLQGWYIPVLVNAGSDGLASDIALAVDIGREKVHLPERLAHSGLSANVRALLKLLLRYRPENRPTAQQVLAHPWFSEYD